MLKRNAKMPFTEIAAKLAISDSTVHIRVKKMQDEGIINKFSISIHGEALGKVECLLMLDVVPGHFEEIAQILMKDDLVETILEIHGEFFAMLRLSANSLSNLREEIIKIGKLPNVTRAEMRPILRVWKEP